MSRLLLISSPGLAIDLRQLFGTAGGAYRLLCLDDGFKDALPVARALADDPAGTLFIGAGDTYLEELVELQSELKALAAKKSAVRPRKHLDRFHANFRERYPYDHLCVAFQPSDNPSERKLELIEEYVSRFGEAPPLNEEEHQSD